jgi:hypothetical protein
MNERDPHIERLRAQGHPVHVLWEKGGAAAFASQAGDAVTLVSTIPSPPGSRLEGALVAIATAAADGDGEAPGEVRSEGEGDKVRVRVKIHGCKRQPDGTFSLAGRAIDFSREVRAKVDALVRTRGDHQPT